MFIPNATLIKNLIAKIMQNRTYNISDKDIERIMNLSRIRENNSYDFEDSDMSCGGVLVHIATTYANVYHAYVAVFVCLFGTVANILNIVVLTRKEMVSAPINRILTALAVADMMLMIEYIPFAYYYHLELPGERDFPYLGAVFMLFHIHITQTLHTVSICLTLTLAIWRYLAIGYPDKNHILCSDRRCTTAITLSYILPVVLCSPTYITLTIKSTKIVEDKEYILYHTGLNEMFQKDQTLNKINFWIYAVFIKLLPCCILTIISSWLIRTLFKAKKRKQVLRGYDSYPLTENGKGSKKKVTKSERRADRTTRMLVAVLLLFLLTEFPQGLFAFFIGLEGTDLFIDCYQKYGDVMDILALINGAINFILYCCMNRMFRTTFGQLFKHKILAKWAPGPPSDIHTTTGNGTNTTEL